MSLLEVTKEEIRSMSLDALDQGDGALGAVLATVAYAWEIDEMDALAEVCMMWGLSGLLEEIGNLFKGLSPNMQGSITITGMDTEGNEVDLTGLLRSFIEEDEDDAEE